MKEQIIPSLSLTSNDEFTFFIESNVPVLAKQVAVDDQSSVIFLYDRKTYKAHFPGTALAIIKNSTSGNPIDLDIATLNNAKKIEFTSKQPLQFHTVQNDPTLMVYISKK